MVETASEIVGVALDGDANTLAHADDGVPRDGVPGFFFVAPPIGEGGDTDVRGGKLISDLVGFEGVVKGAELVAEFLGHGHFGEEFIGTVAVNLDEKIATENIGEGLEF